MIVGYPLKKEVRIVKPVNRRVVRIHSKYPICSVKFDISYNYSNHYFKVAKKQVLVAPAFLRAIDQS